MLLPAFKLPRHISGDDQVGYCLSIIDLYRSQVVPLKRENEGLTRRNQTLVKNNEKLQHQYRQEKDKREELETENERLKREIEKLSKTNRRYQISLFDSGNFSHPKKKSDKKKGGQPGHQDTNRESQASFDKHDYQSQRLFFVCCPDCSKKLSRVSSTKQKQFIDIKLNPEVIKLLLEVERQWCGHCQKEKRASHTAGLPFSEYGLNTLMMVMILRYRCLLTFTKISLTIEVIGGLKLPTATISNLLDQTKQYMSGRYQELTQTVRAGEISYNDETGWLVRGKKAWVWISATQDATVYKAAESRGKGIFEEMRGNSQSYAMHDGYAAYQNTIPPDKQMYCWAHVLRYAFEETEDEQNNPTGVQLRDRLVAIYRYKDQRRWCREAGVRDLISQELDKVLALASPEASVRNIQQRLRQQRTGLINALLYSPDGTNNVAERELRNMVLLRKNSFGSDTYAGMERDAVNASVIQTIHKQNQPLLPTLKQALQAGIKDYLNR